MKLCSSGIYLTLMQAEHHCPYCLHVEERGTTLTSIFVPWWICTSKIKPFFFLAS